MFKRVPNLIKDFIIMLGIFLILPLILQKIFDNPNLKTNYIVFIILFIILFISHAIRTIRKKIKKIKIER